MNFSGNLKPGSEESRVFEELLSENSHNAFSEDGISVCFSETAAEDGKCRVRLKKDSAGFRIEYTDRRAFVRGIGLLLRYSGAEEGFSASETPAFDTVGPMLDCSRNAVMKPEKVKQLIRLSALSGLNALMLYTEDTYEIPGHPYFGRLRGAYTQEELRELDAYAALFGIELIPCIQMLAHLEALFEWTPYRNLRDWDDILNLAEEETYDLLRAMVKSVSETFRSRRINIGMDEAYLLGRGRYLEKKGYRKSSEIMTEHLGKVMEILREYGFRPRMWSDMFFRMCTPDESYYNPECTVTEEVRNAIPEEMTLIYWDYYGTDRGRYDFMMANHFKMTDRVAFAGGTSSWYGMVPLNRFSLNSARAALESARDHGMREIYVTMWGDDGGTCSAFSCLPTLVCYGEANWNGRTDDADLAEAMKAETGADFEAFLNFEELQNFGCRKDFGYAPKNPSRYLLWQDPLQGKYDCHVPEDARARYTEAIFRLMEDRQKCHPKFGFLFDSFSALSDVLRDKADLGILIKTAYDGGNREALSELRDSLIPDIEKRTEALMKVLRKQWMAENKPFGFDVQEIRFGGLLLRLREAREQIGEYLDGKIGEIPELLVPRLPYRESADGDCTIQENSWKRMATSEVLSF